MIYIIVRRSAIVHLTQLDQNNLPMILLIKLKNNNLIYIPVTFFTTGTYKLTFPLDTVAKEEVKTLNLLTRRFALTFC